MPNCLPDWLGGWPTQGHSAQHVNDIGLTSAEDSEMESCAWRRCHHRHKRRGLCRTGRTNSRWVALTGLVEWLYTEAEKSFSLEIETDAQRASSKGPNNDSLEYLRPPLRCYPCRKFPLNSCKSLLFHGGDTGSIPVRDANTVTTCERGWTSTAFSEAALTFERPRRQTTLKRNLLTNSG